MYKVRYTVKPCQIGTRTLLTNVPLSALFDLVLTVKDLRPSGTYNRNGVNRPLVRGVFAAYCDILYERTYTEILGLTQGTASEYLKAFRFSPQYPNGRTAYDDADRMRQVGAFASAFSLGTGELEVARVRMQARRVGLHTFTLDFSSLSHPKCDTLVYGNIGANPPEESYVSPSEIQRVDGQIKVG